MSGIVFNKTKNLKTIIEFYTEIIGADVWLDQGKCILLRHNNFIFGFCQDEKADLDGILTFFYPEQAMVLDMYQTLKEFILSEPKENKQYRIFNFFAKDPEGRTIEFQTFRHNLNSYWTGEELLIYRRSIRSFTPEPVSEEITNKIFELCRYSPTSKNTQAYYYVMTRNKSLSAQLAAQRERAAKPLAKAPVCVAVCTDPDNTIRPEEDGCIAATYFILAAAQIGLGTCWIGGMNTPKVKDLLGIPQNHYIACLTPLGYPDQLMTKIPERREITEFVKIID